ncbi:MAG: ATP-binding protein [Terracidiphilus sp.]
MKAVSEALRRAIQEPGGASLIFVVGPTGVGKTTLRLRIEQELKQRFLAVSGPEPGRIPVVGFEAAAPDSGNFNWKDYYRRALRALEEPLIDYKLDRPMPVRNGTGEWTAAARVCSPELRQALEQALRHRRPAAVLIDEAQHLTKIASGRRLSDQLDCLKSLASLTGCVHVLIGTYELLPCRNLSAQLSRRSLDIHFRRYRIDSPDDVVAFQRVIFTFQRHLPLAQEPELWRDWEFCYTHSLGCVGILKDWFARALADVLDRGAPTLTRADLERCTWSLDQCLTTARDTLDGESVFIEKLETANRLRQLLGFGTKVGAEAAKPADRATRREPRPGGAGGLKRRGRRVGLRRPIRDEIGIRQAG